jgi:hypothetical protein
MPTKHDLQITRYLVEPDTRHIYFRMNGGLGAYNKLSDETREAIALTTMVHMVKLRESNEILIPTRRDGFVLSRESLQKMLDMSATSDPNPNLTVINFAESRQGHAYFRLTGGTDYYNQISDAAQEAVFRHMGSYIRILPGTQQLAITRRKGFATIDKATLQEYINLVDPELSPAEEAILDAKIAEEQRLYAEQYGNPAPHQPTLTGETRPLDMDTRLALVENIFAETFYVMCQMIAEKRNQPIAV